MTRKINEPLSIETTRILKSYLKFPEGESFTAMDWKAEDGAFLDVLTRGQDRFLYGISDDRYFCDEMRNDRGFHKVSQADYRSEAKITNDVFSLMVVNPNVDHRVIEELFNTVDPFTMPNFQHEAEAKVMREEAERERLQQAIGDQINFGELNADNTERAVEVLEETPEKRQERIQKKIEVELEKRIRSWRLAMKEQQKRMHSMRWDHFLLSAATRYIRPGGVLMMITPKELIDDNITYKLVNQYEDVRILRLNDEEYQDYRMCVILARKRRKATREDYELGKALARTKEKPFRTFGQGIREVTVTFEENPDLYARQVFNRRVDMTYGVLERQSEPLYTVPVSDADEVTSFRVGPITPHEALASLQKSKTIQAYQNKYSQVFINKNPVAPTPLHKGHIMLLLTSGFLNGYIGTGPDQHLVKGSAVKDVREFQEMDDEGATRLVEREFYNIGVKLLNSNGEFRKIM
jgi:hypothetical protein